MRRTLISSLAVVWLVAAPAAAAPQIPLHNLSNLRLWLVAVDRHQPGASDGAARTIASWPDGDLDALFVDVQALVKLALGAPGPLLPPGAVRFTAAELDELTALADAERERGLNRRLKLAALLHSDIASLGLLTETNSGRPGVARRSVSILIHDGLGAGFRDSGVHWEFARTLLDGVKPDPAHDEAVLRWYRAAAAFFADRHDYSDALPLLERALRLFPDDPPLLMASGGVAESLSAPAIQNFITAAVLPTGVKVDVRSAVENWRQAERLYRHVVAIDSGQAEAHLRLGRVMGLLGRHAEAATELEQAAARPPDRRMEYIAHLFLGAEYHALNRLDRAREAFEKAAGLFPLAQSPHLAESQLARQVGDRTGALRALRPVLEAGPAAPQRFDPWWTYYDGSGVFADRAMGAMRAALYLDERR